MIIQILLLIVIFVLGWKLLTLRRKASGRALNKIGLLILMFFGIIFVVWPDSTNWIAKSLGVSRGADLMLYALIMIFVFDRINDYIRRREENIRTAKLVRHISLDEYNRTYGHEGK